MSSKPIQYQGKAVAILVNNEVWKRAQASDNSADLGQENIFEVGNADIVEKKDNTPNVTISVDCNDIGSLGRFKAIVSGDKISANASDYDSNGVYKGTYSGANVISMKNPIYDFDNNLLPEFIFKISERSNTTVSQSIHLQGAFISSIAGSYDLTGLAKQTVNFETDNKKRYLGDHKNVFTMVLVPNAGTKTATAPTKGSDETFLRGFVNRAEFAGTWVGTTVTFTMDENFDGTERVIGVYAKGDKISTGDFPALTPTNTGSKGGLRRGAVVISAFKAGTSETRLLRCQSASYNLNFNRQAKNELGTQKDIDRAISYPLSVTCDLTFDASDLENFAIMQGKRDEFIAGTLTEMDVKDFINDLTIKIKLYSDEYDHSSGKLVQTITLENQKVKNESDSIQAGSTSASWKVSLEGSSIVWETSGNQI